LRQWQMRTLIGSPSALNRTAPHRHPPSLVMMISLFYAGERRRSHRAASRGPVGRVSKDDECVLASWFETARERLLTMKVDS